MGTVGHGRNELQWPIIRRSRVKIALILLDDQQHGPKEENRSWREFGLSASRLGE